jgi:hypothetical protein
MTERIYHHYEALEEFQQGMWRIVRGEQRMVNARNAAQLMRDSVAFAAAMRRALSEWPNSCEHNLTAEDTNRLAWLGHAGNLIGCQSPEENTRIGWHMLNQSEQDEANRTAQTVLDEWLASRVDSRQLSLFEVSLC